MKNKVMMVLTFVSIFCLIAIFTFVSNSFAQFLPMMPQQPLGMYGMPQQYGSPYGMQQQPYGMYGMPQQYGSPYGMQQPLGMYGMQQQYGSPYGMQQPLGMYGMQQQYGRPYGMQQPLGMYGMQQQYGMNPYGMPAGYGMQQGMYGMSPFGMQQSYGGSSPYYSSGGGTATGQRFPRPGQPYTLYGQQEGVYYGQANPQELFALFGGGF